ncbi:MAG: hypothetical protein U0175_35705 [Caldilineaceae bacterium]
MTTTLSIVGDDVAGNLSQPLTKTVLVDSVAPVFGPHHHQPGSSTPRTPLCCSRRHSERWRCAPVYNFMSRARMAAARLCRSNACTAQTGPAASSSTRVGVYWWQAVATDLAGNQATQVWWVKHRPVQGHSATELSADGAAGGGGGHTKPEQLHLGNGGADYSDCQPGWSFAAWSGAVVTTTNPTSLKLMRRRLSPLPSPRTATPSPAPQSGMARFKSHRSRAATATGDVITLTATAATGSAFSVEQIW